MSARRRTMCTLMTVVVWIGSATFVYGVEPQQPFPPFVTGERLLYAIDLFSLPAGTATMDVLLAKPRQGRAVVKLVTTARSNDVVSFFFPIRNRVESLVDVADMLPYEVIFQRREGVRHEDFHVVFHREAARVTVVKNHETRELEIPPRIHGPLSCLYYLRSLPALISGTSVKIPIHHDRTNYHVTVEMKNVERMSGPWGDVEVIEALVHMPFRGIFLNEGNVRIWLTTDEYRIPLKMQAKVVIGSAVATLQHVVGGGRLPRIEN